MKKPFTGLFAAVGMLILILDGKTALAGAKEAMDLCLYTVIPSLFPFLVLSSLLNKILLGSRIPVLGLLGRLCGIPVGAESLLLLGLVGGYPVGAQALTEAYKGGSITKTSYNRLLGFCNNAGPSFIFGIIAMQFSQAITAWLIWGVHILSALLVGIVLPGKSKEVCRLPAQSRVTVTQALTDTLRIMAKICGWVLLFRIVIAYLTPYFTAIFPAWAVSYLTGIVELTNGCVGLSAVTPEGLRFLICLCMLNFGGLCVGMQTASVCEGFGTGLYFPGKILQTVFGILLGYPVAKLLL